MTSPPYKYAPIHPASTLSTRAKQIRVEKTSYFPTHTQSFSYFTFKSAPVIFYDNRISDTHRRSSLPLRRAGSGLCCSLLQTLPMLRSRRL